MTVRVHGRTVGGVAVVGLRVGRARGWWYATLTLANGAQRSASLTAGESAAWDWAAAQFDPEEESVITATTGGTPVWYEA